MAEANKEPLRLARQFTVPQQPAVFRGIPSVTGLRYLASHKVLLAAAMDRRVLRFDLTDDPPATSQPTATAAKPDNTKPANSAPGKPAAPVPPPSGTFMTWSHDNWIMHLDVHPDGQRVATGGADRRVKIFRWGEEKPLVELDGHRDWIRAVAFSPNGRLLATAGDDGQVCVWDTDNRKLVVTLPCGTDKLNGVCWTPDGKYVAAAGIEAKVYLWDCVSHRLARTLQTRTFRTIEDEELNGGFSFPGGVRRLACSPDGKSIAAAGLYALSIFSLETGEETLKWESPRTTQTRYWGVVFASATIFAYSMDTSLGVWDLAANKAVAFKNVDQLAMYDLCLLDGGRRVAAGGSKGSVGLWDLV